MMPGRRLSLALLALCLGCGSPAARVEAPRAPIGTSAPASIVRGAIDLPDGAHGTLVVTWLTPDALADPERALENLIVGVERAIVLPASAPSIPFELPVPRDVDGAQLAAWLDHDGAGIEVLFGPPAVSQPFDPASSGEIRIAIPPLEPAVSIERCAGERTELVRVDAPRGSAGGSPQVRLCVFLPRAASARLPVIYALPGLGGDHTNGSARAARRLLDASAPETGRDAIVVGVETSTPLGSSYLVDSPLTGEWSRFVPEQVVAAIDRRYRTIASREGRAVIGHSTGGFDAVTMGLTRPDVFAVLAASSPDALDFEAWMLDESRDRARPRWLAWLRFEDRLGGAGQFASYASAWSPDASAPRGMRWPVDLESGAVVPDVWSRWLAHSPITWLDDPAALERARRMSDRIFLTCGRRDEASLFDPTERFAAALARAGIEHAWVPTDQRHIGGGDARYEPLIPYVMDRLSDGARSASPR